MLEGDEYEDHLLGDPNQLDDIIEGRDLNQPEDEAENDDEEDGDQEPGDGEKKEKPKRTRVLNPQPKLDANRLTGPRGIVAIESLFKDFKFYGAGYEDQDLNRIMKRLELWGNRLFPKFQFDDFLEKVEKLGHKRPVLNFVSKIRMGIVTEDTVAETPKEDNDLLEVDDDDDINGDTVNNSVRNDDVFNQLLEVQQTQANIQPIQSSILPTETTITDEQKERMMRNRLLAEERRLARIKAQQEKVLHSAESSVAPEIETLAEVDGLAEKGNEITMSSHTTLSGHGKDRPEESAVENAEIREEQGVIENMEETVQNIAETSSMMHNVDGDHDEKKLEMIQDVVERITECHSGKDNNEGEGDLGDCSFSNIKDWEVENYQTCVNVDESELLGDSKTDVGKSTQAPTEDVEMKE